MPFAWVFNHLELSGVFDGGSSRISWVVFATLFPTAHGTHLSCLVHSLTMACYASHWLKQIIIKTICILIALNISLSYRSSISISTPSLSALPHLPCSIPSSQTSLPMMHCKVLLWSVAFPDEHLALMEMRFADSTQFIWLTGSRSWLTLKPSWRSVTPLGRPTSRSLIAFAKWGIIAHPQTLATFAHKSWSTGL